MMPMLIDAGKRLLIDALFLIVADARLLIDAGTKRMPRVNQDENSASVGEVDVVTRDDGFEHALYALAFDLDEHRRSAVGFQGSQTITEQSQQRNA
ncbi:hypothetical protein [Burkholderia ubonensis]|uniref:hypothetical protein n=1 Tax=Burkholderia ubonensis TaxID=101571 RepID=UPI0012F8D721|nr:hypothetical protein [Burkholderia ubonensis]